MLGKKKQLLLLSTVSADIKIDKDICRSFTFFTSTLSFSLLFRFLCMAGSIISTTNGLNSKDFSVLGALKG